MKFYDQLLQINVQVIKNCYCYYGDLGVWSINWVLIRIIKLIINTLNFINIYGVYIFKINFFLSSSVIKAYVHSYFLFLVKTSHTVVVQYNARKSMTDDIDFFYFNLILLAVLHFAFFLQFNIQSVNQIHKVYCKCYTRDKSVPFSWYIIL